MKKRHIILVSVVFIVALIVGSVGAFENEQSKKEFLANPGPPMVGLLRPSITEGPATSNTLPSQVADVVYASYGETRNEYRVGNTWILTTLGNKDSSGVIGLYSCSPTDSAALNGQVPLSLSGWKFYKPPFPGGVTLLDINGNTLIIDNGGHQITFDITTKSFGSENKEGVN